MATSASGTRGAAEPRPSRSQCETCDPTGPPSHPSQSTVARTRPTATRPRPQSRRCPRVFFFLRTRAGLRGLRGRAGAARFFLVAMGLLVLRDPGSPAAGVAARPRLVSSAVVTVTVIAIAVAGALARYGLEARRDGDRGDGHARAGRGDRLRRSGLGTSGGRRPADGSVGLALCGLARPVPSEPCAGRRRRAGRRPAVPRFRHVLVDRLREQGAGRDRRQPCGADVHRALEAVRDPVRVRGGHPSEPAELPRARLGVDPGDPLGLHVLRGRRNEPGGHAREGWADVEDLRRGTARARLPGSLCRPLREASRPVSLLPAWSRATPPAGRGSCRSRNSRRDLRTGRLPELRPRRPEPLQRHARLPRRHGRPLAPPRDRAAPPRTRARRQRGLRCLRRGLVRTCAAEAGSPRSRSGRRCAPAPGSTCRRATTASCGRSRTPGACPGSGSPPGHGRSRESGTS